MLKHVSRKNNGRQITRSVVTLNVTFLNTSGMIDILRFFIEFAPMWLQQ